MKLNWKLVKVVLALVIVFATIVWAATSLLPTSYSGSDLTFDVGGGAVTITNPSDAPVPAQLIGSRTRSFVVTSANEGLSASSTRDTSDNTSVYTLPFELPSGTTEFTITRGEDVKFVADTTTQLQANVTPLSADSVRTTLIVAAVVILGALFYASSAIDHQWINVFRQKSEAVEDVQPVTSSIDDEQSYGPQAFGDNRADKTT